MSEERSNVVAIPGYEGAIRGKGEPNKDVVAALESYLDRAKRGDIVGVAIAGVRSDGANSSMWASDGGLSNSLVSSVALMQFRVLEAAMERFQDTVGPPPDQSA